MELEKRVRKQREALDEVETPRVEQMWSRILERLSLEIEKKKHYEKRNLETPI